MIIFLLPHAFMLCVSKIYTTYHLLKVNMQCTSPDFCDLYEEEGSLSINK